MYNNRRTNLLIVSINLSVYHYEQMMYRTLIQLSLSIFDYKIVNMQPLISGVKHKVNE